MSSLSNEDFNKKYKLYSQELMNISYGYTKNRLDSEDIIQNVFIKFINSNKVFKSYDEEKYWLIRVTINECKNYLKSSYKSKVIINDDILDYQSDNSNDFNKLHILANLVKALPEKYRMVIILFYYDSLSIKDISLIIKASESAVKKRLERARLMLKKEMEG